MHDNDQIRNNRVEHIYRLVDATAKSLEKIKLMLKNLDKDDQRKNFVDVAGVTGVFDGINMVTSDGKKFEVPVNYAAKSRMVVGDTLKMVEDEGKPVFKQIEKVDRKKVEGIMTKKEGKWYIISDSGTYKVSDIAADFQHAGLHDEASAFVPAKNLNVGFAALDVVKNKNAVPSTNGTTSNNGIAMAETSSIVNTPAPRPVTTHTEVNAPKPVSQSRPAPRPAVKTQARPASAPRPATTHTARPATSSSAPRPASARPSAPSGNRTTGGHNDNYTDNRGGYKPASRPFKPAVKKEYVEEISNPVQETPTSTVPVNLEDDDLR